MKRLFVQVIVLAGVIIGLSRLAGRQAIPPRTEDVPPSVQAPGLASDGTARMSSAPPDLTFYRTLGDAQSAPARPDLSHRPDTDNNNDAKGGGLRYQQEVPDDRTGAYVVQALSTRDGAAARRLRDRLAARGFPATVSEDKTAGRPVYRVRVGRYATRAEAETAVRVLRQKHHLSPWILQEGK